jgi:hypothetical protein
MIPLICDINIWYGLANKSINPEKLRNYHLVGTGINISEFASTPNLINNLKSVVEAARAMQKYHYIIFKSNFYDHMIARFVEDFEPDDSTNEMLLENLLLLTKIDPESDISQKNINNATKQISVIIDKKNKIAKDFNTRIPEIRQIIKDTGGKKEHREKDFTISHKRFFLSMISNYSKQFYNEDFRISVEDESWRNLDFFIRAWDEYFRTMELQQGMKLHGNDFADLFNLVYVQPGWKYTTMENKWKALFKQDSLLSGYFVDV